MSESELLEHLAKAAAEAVRLAQIFLTEAVEEPYHCIVYDRDGHFTGTFSTTDYVSFLAKESMVPRWVNIYVCDVDDRGVFFRCDMSDQRTADTAEMANAAEGYSPFNPLAPSPPQRLKDEMERLEGSHVLYEAVIDFYSTRRFSVKESGGFEAGR